MALGQRYTSSCPSSGSGVEHRCSFWPAAVRSWYSHRSSPGGVSLRSPNNRWSSWTRGAGYRFKKNSVSVSIQILRWQRSCVGKPVGWSTPPGVELSMGAAAERRNQVAKPAASALVRVSATRSAAACCGSALVICGPSRAGGRRLVRRLGWRGPEAERRGPGAGGQRHSGRAARHRRAALNRGEKV